MTRGECLVILTKKTLLTWIVFFLGVECAAVEAQNNELRFVTWRPEDPQVWHQGIADFEKQNPGVRIIREIGPQSSTQLHDLVAQKLKNRDTRLDVFVMDVIWPTEFASAGWGLPLDRHFTTREQQKFPRG